MATTQFAVASSHIQKIQPDILGIGITDFDDQLPVDPDTNPETVTNPENIAQFVNRKTAP